MFPIWRSTAPLLRSSLPGVRNALSRSSSLVVPSSSPSPLLRGVSSSPLFGTSLTRQQQQQQQQQQLQRLQEPQQPLISSRYYSSEIEENLKAEQLMKKGKELFDSEDYRGSYTALLEAYDHFEKHNKIEHLLIVSTLIVSVCKKGGLDAEQRAFMERAQRNMEPATKEQEAEREKFEEQAKSILEQTSEIYQLQNKGKELMGRQDFEEARKTYFEALKLADKIDPPNHGLIALLNAQCGAIQGHIGEYDQSEGHLRASIRHYKQVVGSNFYLKEYLETLRLLGDLFMKRRRFASAVKEYEVYAAESKKFRSFRESWDGLLLMADCTIKMDEFDKGFELYDDAIQFSKSMQMNSCLIETHIRIGQVKEFLNKPDEGLRHYQSGLALARKCSLVEHQAKCLLHVGNIHRSLKNTQMSDAHLRLAKDLITTSKLTHLAHLCDYYLGKLLLEIGNLTDAGLCLKKAIQTSQQKDLNVYRSALCDYGAILVKEDKPAEALPVLEEALDYNSKFQDHAGMMRCYSHIIQAYRDLGKEAQEREATLRLSELNSILQKKGIAVPLSDNNE